VRSERIFSPMTFFKRDGKLGNRFDSLRRSTVDRSVKEKVRVYEGERRRWEGEDLSGRFFLALMIQVNSDWAG
jgi:hypothetical protein